MSKVSSAIVPPLSVDRSSRSPLHRQLYLHLRELILSGQLRAGARLPSTRDLAKSLDLSRNTVLTAFEQLLADGFLQGRTGAGTFVAPQARRPQGSARGHIHEERCRMGLHPDSESGNLQRLYRTRERHVPRGLGAFRTNAPALDVFPWVTWSQAVHRAMRGARRDYLFYSDPMGVRSFREAVAEYLRTARNVRCEADQIFVVSGSQQALSLTATVLLDPRDRVAVEEPGYTGAWKAFLLNDNVICPVPVGADGLETDSLREHCPDARLVYVTPSHQFPLGVTMSLPRRLELLEWASEANAWIVEDDYDSEYRYSTTPLSSLQGLSDQNRVIYTGTFSKVLFPALRIGYVVIPPDLVDQFALVRESFDLYPSPLLQLALQIFIEQGTFAKHLRTMRGVYSERLAELVACIRKEFGDHVEIGAADSGMHLVMYLPAHIDDREVAVETEQRGVATLALSDYYYGDGQRKGLVLGFGNADLEQIRHGVSILRSVVGDAGAAASR